METYRLQSKVVDNNNEYLLQTANNISQGEVATELFINGALMETVRLPHPEHIEAEEVLTLVQSAHDERKNELEMLFKAYERTKADGDPETVFHLAQAFFFKKFYIKADELFQAALDFNVNTPAVYFYKSKTRLALDQVESALPFAQKAVELKPGYADFRNNLGEIFLASREYKKATLEFDRAISINMYYSDAYYNYGLALLLNALERQETDLFKNFMTRAKDYFQKAALINPEYRNSIFESGIACLDEQEINTAYTYLERVRDDIKEQQRVNAGPYYMKYIIHPNWVSARALAERIRFLEKEVKNNPTYVDLYAELGRCYLMQCRIDIQKGMEHLNKAVEMNPKLMDFDSTLIEGKQFNEQLDRLIEAITKQG